VSLRRLIPALLVLGATPAAAQKAAPITVPYTLDTLPNGLTLIVHEDHSAPTVAVNVWYHVGSGDEQPGRTGFAHLFEHLMFMGSEHAAYPIFDRALEAAGANNNGSTNTDRTNYYESGPTNALPLMLWLEADRMGYLLPVMDAAKVDLQRDVVKNERRQSYENQPYGLATERILPVLYPANHPYHWPVIGSMADLSAASLEDVQNFFRRYYAPNNATLVVAGDVKTTDVQALVRGYFAGIPRGPAIIRAKAPAFSLSSDSLLVLEDRVQLPRLYYAWHSVAQNAPDDAALDLVAYVLAGGKNSRLTKALVFDQQIATQVRAAQNGSRLDGEFDLIATAKPGVTLPQLQATIDREVQRLAAEGPTDRELEQAKNALEARFLGRLEMVAEKADQLNAYFYATGKPDGFATDLARYRNATPADLKRAAAYLTKPKVILSVIPQGKTDLVATKQGGTQ
jgi:zinc protease